jgi:carbamoyltransferase
VNWIRAAIKKTGIGDIVCGGGVFMNVKANMLIAQMPEVRSIYVMPSAADESLSIGACLDRYYQQSGVVDHGESALTDLYLGGAHSRAEEETALKSLRGNGGIRIEPADDPDAKTAALLAEGEIVARCRGRMEWGARALGNRSILASSHDYRMVEKINKSIKQRDFWMPFAPSVREESAARYFDDPKRISPRFMTFAFPTKQETRGDLVAASHIRDHTIRPQVVTRDANEAYHQLLTRFERLTGRGIILNTSFNLHGEPIVASPADAIDVFLRSDLHHLALDSAVISKTANL